MKEFDSVVGNEQFSPSMNFKKCSEVGMLWVNQSCVTGNCFNYNEVLNYTSSAIYYM